MAYARKKELVRDMVKGVAMKDAGRIIKPSKMVVSPPGPRKVYPMLHVSAEQAPFLGEYDLDKECKLVIQAKVVGREMTKSPDYSRDNYTLEIRKIGKVQ